MTVQIEQHRPAWQGYKEQRDEQQITQGRSGNIRSAVCHRTSHAGTPTDRNVCITKRDGVRSVVWGWRLDDVETWVGEDRHGK